MIMKKNDTPQVVRIEINSGTFTIPAGDKLYEITVRQSPTISDVLDGIVTHELASAGVDVATPQSGNTVPSEQTSEESQRIALYKEISEEMFHEIGRLARDLSISIKDLPSCYGKEVDFEKAGLDLESWHRCSDRSAAEIRWKAFMVMPPLLSPDRRSRVGVSANMPHQVSCRQGWNEAAGYCRDRTSL
jgi:hypothetical protein